MAERYEVLRRCIEQDRVEVVDHAYERMVERLFAIEGVIQGAARGTMIEDYLPTRGEDRVLVLHTEPDGTPMHTVWDMPLESGGPAVLVSAYRPDPDRWTAGFTRRKR